MATNENEEGEEDEEEKQVTEIPLVPQSLIKSNPEFHNHNHNHSHNHNLNHNYIFPCETSSSTSMINIFPPINHENLRPEAPDQSLPDQDSEVSASPGAELGGNGAQDAWWDFGFSYLRCKVCSLVSSFRDHSSGFRVGVAAMVVALWYLRVQKQRRRRRIMHKESRDQLIRVIKEKDEVGLCLGLFCKNWWEGVC